MSDSNDRIARVFAHICLQAAIPVMEVYSSDFTAEQKADRSPVTQADRQAETVILEQLAARGFDMPVLAEESFEAGLRPSVGSRFLLVDPVDGTREFIARNGEFTINIALIENAVPVAGCVYAPALGRIFLGGERAFAAAARPGAALDEAHLEAIRVRPAPAQGRIAVMSRSHADEETVAFADAYGVTERLSAGSSLKFCKVAAGEADLYPRFAPTMEWDTAAGHVVLAAAGGRVTRPDGAVFDYGKSAEGFRNGPFIAWGDPALADR